MLSEGPKIEPDKYCRHRIAIRFAELPARVRYGNCRQNCSYNSPKPSNFSNCSATTIAGAGWVRR